jgi:hypothetical protein
VFAFFIMEPFDTVVRSLELFPELDIRLLIDFMLLPDFVVGQPSNYDGDSAAEHRPGHERIGVE